MCKHVIYNTILNYQMNIVYQLKIKNRKKRDGGVWLIRARTQNITFNCNNTTKDKTKARKAVFDMRKAA